MSQAINGSAQRIGAHAALKLTARFGWHAAEIGGQSRAELSIVDRAANTEAGDQHLFGTSAS